MERLFIVNPSQFGYHTDAYMYCKYLKHEYDITYLCWDFGYPQIDEKGVRVVYLRRDGTLFHRMIRFLGTATRLMRQVEYDIVFLRYFRFCSVLRLTGRYKKIVFDVRTSYVQPGRLKRLWRNALIFLESQFFQNISVITEELRATLYLSKRRSHILPLGAEMQDCPPKRFDSMRLLYIGTFSARDIHKSIEGFDRFAREYHDALPLSYDIVGFGSQEEEKRITDAIASSAFPSLINFHGRVAHKMLGPFFAKCNIGIVYVPIVKYQEPQPYTKTFEYLLAGMPALATANATNVKVIDSSNGVLCLDSAHGVYEGLRSIYSRLGTYDSIRIKENSKKYLWETIINDNLKPYLKSLK